MALAATSVRAEYNFDGARKSLNLCIKWSSSVVYHPPGVNFFATNAKKCRFFTKSGLICRALATNIWLHSYSFL